MPNMLGLGCFSYPSLAHLLLHWVVLKREVSPTTSIHSPHSCGCYRCRCFMVWCALPFAR